MKKVYNEKHDALITVYHQTTATEPKQGEMVPHVKIVREVQIYQQRYQQDNMVFDKVHLTRDFILDLAEQIKDIQSQEVILPYDDLPF